VLLSSIAIRLGLIVYSEWHDAHSVVKYTDVDYRVFTDASAFLASPGPGETNRAQGPFGRAFNVGEYVSVVFPGLLNVSLRSLFFSPYTRETYRYTPLLALLLTPNGWLHPSFGKYLFALCDVLNGIMIYRLLKTEILPKTRRTAWPVDRLATVLSAVHLLNPLVFSISTRGSSEAVLSLFVLGTLYAALKERWDLCAVLLGLSTHWKIYPVIYGVGCLGAVGGCGAGRMGIREWFGGVVNRKTVTFGVVSAGTFLVLGLGCYALWVIAISTIFLADLLF
jgi:phosphatidylinositol glycan class M